MLLNSTFFENHILMCKNCLPNTNGIKSPPQIRNDSKNGEWQDILVDDVVNQENILVKTDEFNRQREYVERAMTRLDDRERRIFTARRLLENRPTLRELSVEFGVSRERDRQIEVRAYNKVQEAAKSEYLAAEYNC